MGTLRIKRGTKTALQTSPGYTPLEGELVYTTDSKEVFVGDGTTVGGTPVSVSTQNIEDLGNVQALAAQQDQILVYNGSNWAATDNPALDVRGNIYADDSTLLVDAINGRIVGPIVTDSISTSGAILGDLVGDVTGSLTGNVVGSVLGNVTGNLTGDLTGSVFSDDSTQIIDGINGAVTTNIITGTNQRITLSTTQTDDGRFIVDFTTKDAPVVQDKEYSTLLLSYENLTTDVSTNNNRYGRIEFARRDTGGEVVTGMLQSNRDYIGLFQAADGDRGDISKYMMMGEGQVAIGAIPTPSNGLKLDVNGPAQITGNTSMLADATVGGTLGVTGATTVSSTLKLGQFTTTERDALSAENGMLIYNTSTNKLQGYENGAWVNIV